MSRRRAGSNDAFGWDEPPRRGGRRASTMPPAKDPAPEKAEAKKAPEKKKAPAAKKAPAQRSAPEKKKAPAEKKAPAARKAVAKKTASAGKKTPSKKASAKNKARAKKKPPSSRDAAQLRSEIEELQAELEELARKKSDADRQGDAHEMLSQGYFARRWGRLGVRRRTEPVDPFGYDEKTESRARGLLDFLHRSYFRIDTEGVDSIPKEGRCLVVANHSGGPIPLDGLMLRTVLRREHPQQRELRWLTEDSLYHLPFVGMWMSRLGAVRACPDNARRLLEDEGALAVFPEGEKGVGKLFRQRYQLQRFGRGGFVRLALRSRAPIVPCAIVGAEEANPLLFRVEYMARSLGVPFLPVTPTFPWLGPLGLLPAPTKWRIRFGQPVHFEGCSPADADDPILVGRLAEQVRESIQQMLAEQLVRRTSVFFG
jgi:1-acyl-sn-glycerol-3-phosphate acyltransferase